MSEKNILITGEYNYLYLSTLIGLAQECLYHIHYENLKDINSDRKLKNSFDNVHSYFYSVIKTFGELGKQRQESYPVLHEVKKLKEKEQKNNGLVEIPLDSLDSGKEDEK